jgi:hypothetical protein
MVSVLAGRSRGPARHHGAARVLVEDLVLDRVVVAGAEHPDEDRAHDVAGWVADLGDLEGAVDVASRGEGGDPQRRIGVEEECAGAGVGGGEVTRAPPLAAGSEVGEAEQTSRKKGIEHQACCRSLIPIYTPRPHSAL